MTNKTKPTNAPVYKKRHGRLQISIFENLSEEGKINFSTYIQRNYKNGDGQWKTGAFSEMDLDDLVQAKQLAVEAIKERKGRYSNQQLQ